MLTFGSLFSGIGGMDLGFERAGLRCVWQVEIDDFCRRVLAKHWPSVRRHDDVKTFPPQKTKVEDWRCDVVVGGFPCQDVSTAGRRAGIGAGTRSGLWSEFARIVRLLRPRFVVVENTPGLLAPIRNRETREVVAPAPVGRVLGELSEMGFDAEWAVVSAAEFGAPHIRERVFIVAHPPGHRNGQLCLPARQRAEGEGETDAQGPGPRRDANPDRKGLPVRVGVGGYAREKQSPAQRGRAAATRSGDGADPHFVVGPEGAEEDAAGDLQRADPDRLDSPFVGSGWWGAEPDVVRMVYGVPRRVVRPAISGLGNAVVPQVAEYVARRLVEFAT